MKFISLMTFPLIASGLGSSLADAADVPSKEEMWQIIQEQQQEIDSLKSGQKANTEKVEAAVDVAEQSNRAVAKAASWAENTQVGGYGELHYNNLDTRNGRDKAIDFHRFVLFFGHQFTDSLRFASEVEIEHIIAGDGKNGEVEVEQAYIEYDINDRLHARGGVFLVPVGILNETHEPPTFYGVERNPVEKNIIPTTWWAGGAGLTGELGNGFSFDTGIHEGLKTTAAKNFAVRSGRQKTSEADAHDLAATGRLKWTGMPGVELAATLQYQQDITQGDNASAGNAWLYEMHAAIQRGPFGLRALYARWDLDGSGPKAVGADEQTGFYIEPSFKITPRLGVFARYNQWDNRAGNSSDTEMKQYDAGINYWPHPDVVLKADYQIQDNADSRTEKDGFNLGIGYQF